MKVVVVVVVNEVLIDFVLIEYVDALYEAWSLSYLFLKAKFTLEEVIRDFFKKRQEILNISDRVIERMVHLLLSQII